ncbi:DUF2225 domain-containing protein [Bacillus sp. DJP31]|uniref:DUF2225 domain-containing protein n=1 Tax=Bacillus sp. DJP31 TaxID=3409789 RepID=UPI003BB75DD2
MENQEKLFDRSVVCTICSQNHTTKKVRYRYIRALRSDSDFCSYYEDEENSPLLYYVSVCPNCGYAASDEFSTYFPPNSKVAIEHAFSSGWKNKDYGKKRSVKEAIEAYKLAIYCATLKKEKHIVLAGLYMRLVWILRKESMTDQEVRFMKLAVSEYVQSYSNEDYESTDMSQVKLLYLIGDLYRRLNDEKQAILYLSRVIQHREETLEKRMIELAREAWKEIRESQKLNLKSS